MMMVAAGAAAASCTSSPDAGVAAVVPTSVATPGGSTELVTPSPTEIVLAPDDVTVAAAQAASLADRLIGPSELTDFKAAAAVPSVSPVLSLADETRDLIVGYDMVEPAEMVVVVRKPVTTTDYVIDDMPDGASAFEYLNDHLDKAAEIGAVRVVFPPDQTFVMDRGAPLKIREMIDVDIDLNGSTLEFTDASVAIRVQQSHRVSIRNGTLVGPTQLSSVAEVSHGQDGRPSFAVVDEFVAALEADQVEAERGPTLFTVGLAEQDESGAYRIKTDEYVEIFTNRKPDVNRYLYVDGTFVPRSPLAAPSVFEDGQLVWLQHQNNAGAGVRLDNEDGVSDVTIEDLTFVNIPGMGIIGEVQRGLHINRVTMVPTGEAPALFAVSSDAVHINANGGDIVIENSYFGPNGDDKINIKGNYFVVAEISEDRRTLDLEPAGRGVSLERWGSRGDQLVFVDGQFGVIGSATLDADSRQADDRSHRIISSGLPPEIEPGMLVANVDRGGGRMVIRNNVFSETRAQAILVQTTHVLVADNEFDGIAGPAIKLNLALANWYEAVNTDNVVIVGNRFRRSSLGLAKSNELIHFNQFDDAASEIAAIGNVRIENNTAD